MSAQKDCLNWLSWLFQGNRRSDISQKYPEGFATIEELNTSFQNQRFEKALSQKTWEQQVQFLEENHFQKQQISKVTWLMHFMRERKVWGQEVILYDSVHKKCISWNEEYICTGMSVNLKKDGSIFGISILRRGRYYFYTLWKQYFQTTSPILVKNSNSSDGWFSSPQELDRFLQLMYSPTVWWKN